MTPRDEHLFAQGMLLGMALVACGQHEAFAEIDQRLQRVERALRPPPRPRYYFVPAGWLRGRRTFFVVGRS
jgi:hypothetical protein